MKLAKLPNSRRPRPTPIPPPTRSGSDLGLARILVPVDFSPTSRRAVTIAQRLAKVFGSQVTLVHVVEQIVYPGNWAYPLATLDFTESRKAILEEMKGLAGRSGAGAHRLVRLGRPWEEICKTAKELKSDVIIIGTHGYSGVKHVLLGSVAEKVVRHAPCPVLTVRRAARP